MIVSHSHKFIFVHIPKNAGTTVEGLLQPHLNPDTDLHISKEAGEAFKGEAADKIQKFRLRKHVPAHHLRTKLLPEIYDFLFSFAISRNPYSRAMSAYKFISSRAEMDKRRADKGLPPTSTPWQQPNFDRTGFTSKPFDEVCQNLEEVAANFSLFRPQTHWLPKVDSVNYVGRLRSLSEDMRTIFRRIGLPTDELDNVPVANMKAVKGSWREMSAASASAIREFYAEDFARFAYNPDFSADDSAPARKFVVKSMPTAISDRAKRQAERAERVSARTIRQEARAAAKSRPARKA